MKIAIIGYGVVGSGVAEVIKENRNQIFKKTGQEISVKYVLDLRDFAGDPVQSMLIKDFGIIENDKEVQIVVEAIGGETIAYDYAKRALLSGKSVCTPNKALMAKHGAELFLIAKQKGVSLLFEASVGGGIPLIRPYNDALLTDEIQVVTGILNGTSNYILTQMSMNGTSYNEALQSAQKLGYAEQDPTADVGSFDACRKLSILLSLAVGKQVDYEDIKTEGIEKISVEDFDFAKEFGFTLKQLVSGQIRKNGVEAIAAPFLVPLSFPMAVVNDVYNACWVKGKTTGNVMFYGSGAGKLPTASAVVSNIVDAVLCKNAEPQSEKGFSGVAYGWTAEKTNILPASEYVWRKVIRCLCDNSSIDAIQKAVDSKVITHPKHPGFAAWITPLETEAQTNASLENLKKAAGIKSIERVLRIYDPE